MGSCPPPTTSSTVVDCGQVTSATPVNITPIDIPGQLKGGELYKIVFKGTINSTPKRLIVLIEYCNLNTNTCNVAYKEIEVNIR